MVNIYNDIKHEIIERMACDLFEEYGVEAEKINPGNMIDILLKLDDRIKVDIEKNEGFSRVREIPVDFVAACKPRTVGTSISEKEDNLFGLFAQKQNIQVTEKGKHFEPEGMDYLIVFFYDEFIDANKYNRYENPRKQKSLLPDYTLVIKSDELTKHIQENSAYYFDHIEIKRKTNNQLINKVDSSVVNVSVDKLRKETNCLFYEQLALDKEEVLEYLSL